VLSLSLYSHYSQCPLAKDRQILLPFLFWRGTKDFFYSEIIFSPSIRIPHHNCSTISSFRLIQFLYYGATRANRRRTPSYAAFTAVVTDFTTQSRPRRYYSQIPFTTAVKDLICLLFPVAPIKLPGWKLCISWNFSSTYRYSGWRHNKECYNQAFDRLNAQDIRGVFAQLDVQLLAIYNSHCQTTPSLPI